MKLQSMIAIIVSTVLSVPLTQTSVGSQGNCFERWLPSETRLQMSNGQTIVAVRGGVSIKLGPAVDVGINDTYQGRYEYPAYIDGKRLWVGFGKYVPAYRRSQRTVFYCAPWRPINNPQ